MIVYTVIMSQVYLSMNDDDFRHFWMTMGNTQMWSDQVVEEIRAMQNARFFHKQAEAMPKKCAKKETQHWYMFTFTLKPSIKSKGDIKKAYDWICKNVIASGLMPVKGTVCISEEKHKNGRPHWHVRGCYGRSIKPTQFKYYGTEKKPDRFGIVKFDKSYAGNGENSINYISKEVEPTLLY